MCIRDSWNGTRWQSMGSGIAGGDSVIGPTVSAIAVTDNQVFIGGDFSFVDGVASKNISVYSGGGWHAVGGGTDGDVQSLAASGGYLYAGGSFFKAGGKRDVYKRQPNEALSLLDLGDDLAARR